MIPYKDDNPTTTTPYATLLIMAVNIIVFVFQALSMRSGQDLAYSFGAIPYNMTSFESDQAVPVFMSVFTSMFMHGGLLHLGGNLLYLWIFGDNIEDRLGHFRFILFYLFSGLVAAYTHALTTPGSVVPMIGASGAISGVLGAYALLFPSARVHTVLFFGFFVQVVKIPALIVIGFWAIIQLLSSLMSQTGASQGGVAWFAHIGGFMAGLLTIKLWLVRRSKTW